MLIEGNEPRMTRMPRLKADTDGENTPRELEVAEQIVKSEDPLTIEINLSRKVEAAGSLSEQSANPRDDFRRRGLAWMQAA